MSIIERNSQIPFMYNIRHKYDVEHEDFCFNYEDEIFDKTVSPFLLINDKIKAVTKVLSKIFAVMIEDTESIKNMFYYTHNKYYNKNER